jgi:hypothetical protein
MTEQTITIYRGEAPVLNFTLAPVVDISGWTLKFTVAKKSNSVTKMCSATPTILSGPAGTFRATLTAAQTDIAPGAYFFDVWRLDAGFEEVLASGEVVVVGVARIPTA